MRNSKRVFLFSAHLDVFIAENKISLKHTRNLSKGEKVRTLANTSMIARLKVFAGKQTGAQVASLVVFILLIIFAALSYEGKHVFLTAITAGALGGLAHELVQSKGTYILPHTDNTGNFCLGGLFGIVSGGLAGLIMYSGLDLTAGIKVSGQLFTQAFLAGLAVKGVADAVQPPKQQPN